MFDGLRAYGRLHKSFLAQRYRRQLLASDGERFAKLFNLKAKLLGSPARVRWTGSHFEASDLDYPGVVHAFRHQEAGDLFFERGFSARVANLGEVYLLDRIEFRDGDTFLDCGANIGILLLYFELREVAVRYVGFEPSPAEFACLKANAGAQAVHNVALWNAPGELKFYVSSQFGDSSLIEPPSYDEVVTAKVCRLEEFITGPVRCLKLEAEGAEPEIVDGIGEKLHLIDYITADVGFERGVRADSTLPAVTNRLLQRDFELVDISRGRLCALYRNRSTTTA